MDQFFKMKFGTRKEYYSAPDVCLDENLAAFDLIQLLAPLEPEECMRNLVEFHNLVALWIDFCAEELALIHHIFQVGKSLKKSKFEEKGSSVEWVWSFCLHCAFQVCK